MTVEVDARELSRNLLHARIEIPAQPGPMALWYPKWIPGIHAPRGPIENLAGPRLETLEGETVAWSRDQEEPFKFHCEVPDRAGGLVVRLDYICNQPTVNSKGIDSYGNSLVGVINWNTCLLVPDGVSNQDIEVRLSVRLPDKWRFATALATEREEDGVVHFAPASLSRVIDSPLIGGEHLRVIDLDVTHIPPVSLCIASESPAALQIGEQLEGQYTKIADQAGLLFVGAHFDAYKLLVICSDDLPYMGLEHLRSSLNGVGERDLLEEEKLRGWVGYLLPHEFAHSWCGKYRRPAGMATSDYHTPKQTRLLWVYEGLTQYLGELLTVRGGLWTFGHYKQHLAGKISYLMRREGRRWRSLEDTAIDSHHLRGGSKHWSNLRRGQDYYNEGLLMWLEADAIIRRDSDGRRSLDDFCRMFMGPDLPDVEWLPFEERDILDILNELADHDWEAFLAQWIKQPQVALPLEFVGRLGYRIQYATEPSEALKEREKERKYASALDSLGLEVDEKGVIGSNVVPGMPADAAGLAPGMEVIGVNGRKYSPERFRDAIADSPTKRQIECLVLDGDVFQTLIVEYADGPKYLELIRDESQPDILADIFAPVDGESNQAE